MNLFRFLQRENKDAANEFSTLKELKSPNTWVCLPAGYLQFVHTNDARQGKRFDARDADIWLGAMSKTLRASDAVMPPIPKYESFPWAASVGEPNPLKLHTVFDDRYFMASNELNLLTCFCSSRMTDAVPCRWLLRIKPDHRVAKLRVFQNSRAKVPAPFDPDICQYPE